MSRLSSAPTRADAITVTETDDEAHPYDVLGDVTVTGRQVTIFGSIPTRNDLKDRMREAASDLGADAVILVRFGPMGAGGFSWQEMEGKGRAIRYRR